MSVATVQVMSISAAEFQLRAFISETDAGKMPWLNIFSLGLSAVVSARYARGEAASSECEIAAAPPAPYMSLLRVHAQLTLQARHQPLVRVVRHQSHQLHPSLDLEEQRKEEEKKTM